MGLGWNLGMVIGSLEDMNIGLQMGYLGSRVPQTEKDSLLALIISNARNERLPHRGAPQGDSS